MSEESNSYDTMPYHSDPFPQTHPAVLSSVATLLGVQAPPVDQCRILEIACASGGNLIPMAIELPGSHFTGIDLSAHEIKEANEIVSLLGLKNIEFRQMDVKDVTPEFGQFDYIIAHGVYSWVPSAVADKILDICSKNLSPNGIAYVSYNTLPGWHLRGMIRDMMNYHTRSFKRPEVKVRQARALLNFLSEAVPGENNPYGMHLKNELDIVRRMRDSYIFHEHLEDENNPIYFHEFLERADKHDLQYLGEAQFGIMAISATHGIKAEVWNAVLQVCNTPVEREQYLDFLRNRQFRQTLLVHKNVNIDRSLNPEHVAPLYVSTNARTKQPLDVKSSEPEQLELPSGLAVPVRFPLMKAALSYLMEVAPKAVSFTELRRQARSRLPQVEGQDDEALIKNDTAVLGTGLRSLYAMNFVEFSTVEPPTSAEVAEKPATTPLVRYQAQRGATVTNRRHRSIPVNEFDRRVLEQLDGTRTNQDLHKFISELIRNGTLAVARPGNGDVDNLIDESLNASLQRFKRSNLLVH